MRDFGTYRLYRKNMFMLVLRVFVLLIYLNICVCVLGGGG